MTADPSDLGKYRLIAQLGRGGMAEIYLALASGPAGFNKLVVVKQIREQIAEEEGFLEMFLDEARLAARLNHPNVVQTNEVGGDGKHLFIAMEYLEGQPLNRMVSRIGRAGGLTLAMQLKILSEALVGLHYAHELRDFDGKKLEVIHRDVTPHNVFVCYSGQVKIVDFGVAKVAGASAPETRAGVIKGKVAYMAPEQVLGDAVDRRADIFSVGVMLWEALAERRLFQNESDLTIMHRIVSGEIPSPRSVCPEVSSDLEAICMKALATDREGRHATAAELQAELEGVLDAMDDPPLLRDIGRLVTARFEADRAKIDALVEARLSAFKAAPSASQMEPLPVLLERTSKRDLPVFTPTDDGNDAHASRPSGSRARAKNDSGKTDVPAVADLSPLPEPSPEHRSSAGALPETRSRAPWAALWIAGSTLIAIAAATFTWRYKAPSDAHGAGATHRLFIESMPPGAAVLEGGAQLGTTPMLLSLDPTQSGPRQFEVSLAGYVPYTIHQSPTPEDVRVVVPLQPVSPSSAPPNPPVPPALPLSPSARTPSDAGSSPAGPRRTPSSHVHPATPTTARHAQPQKAPAPPLDIHLNR